MTWESKPRATRFATAGQCCDFCWALRRKHVVASTFPVFIDRMTKSFVIPAAATAALGLHSSTCTTSLSAPYDLAAPVHVPGSLSLCCRKT